MEKARQIIREVLSTAEHPAVLSSFGKDSMLLLSLVREVAPETPVIWFHSGLASKRFAERMILNLDLHVWSWRPSDVYVLPNDKGLSLIREQAFGRHRFPMVLDIEDGEKCVADFPQDRTPELYPHFDALLFGYKETDEHWTLGGSGFCPPDGFELGKAKVYAPLRNLTDEDVWAAIKELGVPYDMERYDNGGTDPDSIQACTNCLQEGAGEVFCKKEQKMIERINWQPQERLKEFRQRFSLKEVA
jgi:3'-phosphoadenosine 5'-phosphosulfate sulfotransferase (PAPS reductase)/FAD synthetase